MDVLLAILLIIFLAALIIDEYLHQDDEYSEELKVNSCKDDPNDES